MLGQNEKALECHERAVEIPPQAIGGWVRCGGRRGKIISRSLICAGAFLHALPL